LEIWEVCLEDYGIKKVRSHVGILQVSSATYFRPPEIFVNGESHKGETKSVSY